jgi:hypothetical protein
MGKLMTERILDGEPSLDVWEMESAASARTTATSAR